MQIQNLIAEIESEFSQYKSAGLIDRTSIYRWANLALKKFGQSICVPTEKTIQIKDSQGELSSTFHSLIFAVKCNPKGYYMKEESKPLIQNSLIWKERVERGKTWNSCSPCCSTQTEKVITENIYIDEQLISFYYDSPQPLRLTRAFKKDICAKDCRNTINTPSEYEINIIGNTVYTNFSEGTIYIQYYGIEEDEDGFPIIMDTPKRALEVYIEYHLKKRLLEKFVANGDDTNIANLLVYYSQQEREKYDEAVSDVTFMTLTVDSYKKLANRNRARVDRIKFLTPKF